jgi:drug/metabolite transporter (DMT)-like permease
MNPRAKVRRAPEWQVWTALLIVYIVWGSTYLAIRVVDETMPPLLAAGLRHSVAGLIIFALLAVTRGVNALRLGRADWLGAGFVGLCLLLGGNGLVVLGERDVPSGLAALIIAVVPLFVVVLRRIFGERVATGTYIGVAGGFAGMAVLIVPHGITGDVNVLAMLMLVGASFSWAVGSYYSKRLSLPRDPLASTGVQMVVGGVSLAIAGSLFGEWGLVKVNEFSTSSVLALGYLILFGSVLAYTAYTWVLQHASVSRVSTYAYVNPVVAIVLGAAILNETVDIWILLGAAIIVVSVALVIRSEASHTPGETAMKTPTEAAGASPAASEEILAATRD